MALQDPISDYLTRIRNGLAAKKFSVCMPSSSAKIAISTVLKDEGYIDSFSVKNEGALANLTVTLKYFDEKPAILSLTRVSRPGCRVYTSAKQIPKVSGGLGVTVISTPKGVMTGRAAYKANIGGEIICEIF